MGPERRSRADQGQPGANPQGEEPRARPGPKVKSFEIDKRLIVEAWEKVRANNGAPGVDAVGIGLFQEQLRDNLFKLWNRMSSGSYFPGPVRGVEIPKDHGDGVRLLGVPNTADRVAQTQTSGSALCDTCGFCTALSIFHREEVSRYGTQQEILRHEAPMDEES